MEDESARLGLLRDALFDDLVASIADVHLNGPPLTAAADRLPGNLSMRFDGVDGETLMLNMPNLAVSSGSACTSANPEPSHVLRAIGLSDDATRSSLRIWTLDDLTLNPT